MKHINGLIFVLAIIVAIAIGAHCQDQDELLKTPAVLSTIAQLHSHTFNASEDKTEWSSIINEDGTVSTPYSSHDWSSNHLTVQIGSTKAILHSHPTGTAPQPSQGDLATAKKCGIPNYEISFYYIYVAESDGKTVRKVANLSTGKHGVLVIQWVKP